MRKKRDETLNETTVLLKELMTKMDNPESVTGDEKKRIKKLIKDPTVLVAALQVIAAQDHPDEPWSIPPFAASDDTRTDEQIIADNYITLAKFTIDKLGMTNVIGLKAMQTDDDFVIYALNPQPIELDIRQFATSDYPDRKELLLEAEALQADLFTEDNTEQFRLEVINIINNAKI